MLAVECGKRLMLWSYRQTSAVAVDLSIVINKGMRLYNTVLMMVCSGMLAPDPSACDVRRRGDVVANAVAQSSIAGSRIPSSPVSIFPIYICITSSSHRVMFSSIAVKAYQLFIDVNPSPGDCRARISSLSYCAIDHTRVQAISTKEPHLPVSYASNMQVSASSQAPPNVRVLDQSHSLALARLSVLAFD
jgi:hypothetical protein